MHAAFLPRPRAMLAAGALAIAATAAHAEPADKVYQPIVEYREFEVELRGGYVHDRDPAVNTAQQYVMDLGYGMTPWWFSEVVMNFKNDPDSSAHVDALELENIFQLTEQGKYWADLGLFTEYEHPKAKGDPDEIVAGPMLQKEIGRTVNTLDLLASRQIGAGRDPKTHGAYRFQSQWRTGRVVDVGVQAFGDLTGDEKSQMLGPAIFADTHIGDTHIKFDAGVPIGLTHDSPDLLVRWQLELEFH
ncbi:MAG TPA: hypothetical protein VHE37_04775 [Nevskiaceae bacterium]|nr:hypothetical protein [Nevskiaceae bacterium]